MTDAIEAQVERFAPGFRDLIAARSALNAADVERRNPNYVGGDINGGVQDLRQLFTRPVARPVPYSTPVDGLYICSSSTPPGGGVHGMCGYWAARAALRLSSGQLLAQEYTRAVTHALLSSRQSSTPPSQSASADSPRAYERDRARADSGPPRERPAARDCRRYSRFAGSPGVDLPRDRDDRARVRRRGAVDADVQEDRSPSTRCYRAPKRSAVCLLRPDSRRQARRLLAGLGSCCSASSSCWRCPSLRRGRYSSTTSTSCSTDDGGRGDRRPLRCLRPFVHTACRWRYCRGRVRADGVRIRELCAGALGAGLAYELWTSPRWTRRTHSLALTPGRSRGRDRTLRSHLRRDFWEGLRRGGDLRRSPRPLLRAPPSIGNTG